jgi:hypothetical protein
LCRYGLGETKKLQKNLRGGYDDDDGGVDRPGSPGWTLEGARRSMMETKNRVTADEVERNMLDREEVLNRAPQVGLDGTSHHVIVVRLLTRQNTFN